MNVLGIDAGGAKTVCDLEELGRRLPGIAPRGHPRGLEVEPAVGAVRLALAGARGSARIPAYVG